MDWKTAFENDPRFGGIYQKVTQPAWPIKAAVLSGLLVVVLPLLLVILTGLIVGVVVYLVGNFLRNLGQLFTGTGSREAQPDVESRDNVRENVRVIPRP